METKSAVLGAAGMLLAGGLAFGLIGIANADNQPAAPAVTTSTTATPSPAVTPSTTPEPVVTTTPEPAPAVEQAPVVAEPVPTPELPAPEYVVEPAPVVVEPVAPVEQAPIVTDLPEHWTPATAVPAAPGVQPLPNPQPPEPGFKR